MSMTSDERNYRMNTPPPLPDQTIPAAIATPAGFWIRLLATVIDSILLLILTLPSLLLVYGGEYFQSAELIKGPADFLICYVFPAVLVIVFWVMCRGTPGKLILGLRVVDARTGEGLDLLQSVIRYLGYFVSTLPLCLGFLWIAFDARKQGFHDKLARTLVVHKAGLEIPDRAPELSHRPDP